MNPIIAADSNAVEEQAAVVQKLCAVCEIAAAQYKCPACSMMTCSLVCCKAHKTKWDCSGQRERSSFVKSSEYSEPHLKSDFHFLEDVLQSKQVASRTTARMSQTPATVQATTPAVSLQPTTSVLTKPVQTLTHFPPNARKLVKVAQSRGTLLILMSPGMFKRSINTTKVVGRKENINWRVNLVFVLQLPSGNTEKSAETSISSSFSMKDMLSNSLHGTRDQNTVISNDNAFVGISLPMVDESTILQQEIYSQLDSMHEGNLPLRFALKVLRTQKHLLKCMMQKLPSAAHALSFIETDMSCSIKAVLQGKTVLEYPTFYVGIGSVLDSNLPAFISITGEEVCKDGVDSSIQMPDSTPGEDAVATPTASNLSTRADPANSPIPGEGAAQEDNILLAIGHKRAYTNISSDDDTDVLDTSEPDDQEFLTLLKSYETKGVEELKAIVNSLEEESDP